MSGKKVAVILSGAVAKGAYEAGALRAVVDSNLEVTRIVAASSGALNAVFLAHAIARGQLRQGIETLVELWREHAGFRDVFSIDLASCFRAEGLSNQRKLRALMQRNLTPGPAPLPISLRIVVAPLGGHDPHELEQRAATEERAAESPIAVTHVIRRTTHEYVCDFDQTAFEDAAGIERVITAAVASAAFPFAFVPVAVPEVGACVDGGTVNNTPVKWALGGPIGDALEAIVVISPKVEFEPVPPLGLRGMALADQVLAILIDERLNRDLDEAEKVNVKLDRLRARLPPDQLKVVLEALQWETVRRIEIKSIRPRVRLDGSAFSGFRHANLRDDYLRIGEARAREVLDKWLEPLPAPVPIEAPIETPITVSPVPIEAPIEAPMSEPAASAGMRLAGQRVE